MSDEKVAAAKAEVQRLLDAGFICEVLYPSWLVNIVMVKKNNGKCAHILLTSTSVAQKMISCYRG
jgi:hypothetical protein